MKMFTKKLSIGLLAVTLGSAVIGAAGPAMAKGGHGGGWGHGHSWGHRHHGWGYGFGGYTPAYYYGGYSGGCYLKKYVTYYGGVVFKKVCY
jgi:hypothetical protein